MIIKTMVGAFSVEKMKAYIEATMAVYEKA